MRTWVAAFGLLSAGCAAAVPGYVPNARSSPTDTGGGRDPRGTYQLSAAEQALDCKRLNGRIQVKLVQIRDALQAQPNAVSEAARTVTAPAFGGARPTAETSTVLDGERAVVVAYNRQLAAKGCPTFDIDAELAKRGGRDLPQPVRKPG